MNSSHSTTCLEPHARVKCSPDHKISKFDSLVGIIEKISAIALGVFSAYTSRTLFVPYFFVGFCIGIYSNIQNKDSCDHPDTVSSCAHGLLEQLTGVKLPRIVSLAANIAVTVCHIDHHETVFVPVIGISLGAWAGKTALQCGDLIHKKIVDLNPKTHAACC